MAAFQPAGVPSMRLPDGEIVRSTLEDAQRVLDALHRSPWQIAFLNNEAVPLFVSDIDGVATIRVRLPAGASVNFDLAGAPVRFDFDLQELTSQAVVDDLFDLIDLLICATGRGVGLTEEGGANIGDPPVVMIATDMTVTVVPAAGWAR